jgi:hypothetical protein
MPWANGDGVMGTGGANAPPRFLRGAAPPLKKELSLPRFLNFDLHPPPVCEVSPGPETQRYLPPRTWRKSPAGCTPSIYRGGLSPPSILHLAPPHMERFRRPCMMHEPNGRPLHYASVDAERR